MNAVEKITKRQISSSKKLFTAIRKQYTAIEAKLNDMLGDENASDEQIDSLYAERSDIENSMIVAAIAYLSNFNQELAEVVKMAQTSPVAKARVIQTIIKIK